MKNIVSADWLAAKLSKPNLIILDCSVQAQKTPEGLITYESGLPLFLDAHIPGAQHADLVDRLRDTEHANLFALPDPEQFRNDMAALAVGDDTTVVLYDRSLTAWAARVWWMLRWIGFDRAMILDGGLPAWQASHATVGGAADPVKPGTLTLAHRPEVVVTTEQVRAAVTDNRISLIDTLSPECFRGEENNYARPGHVKGAENVFTLSHFEEGRFKSEGELKDLTSLPKDQRLVTYCGAGILASATAFLLIQLGYDDVALYAASLQEWAADPENPMQT